MTKLSDMRIVVIENNLGHLNAILSLLKKTGIPADQIWPSAPSSQVLFNTWAAASGKIYELQKSGFDPKKYGVLLLLDIILNEDDAKNGDQQEFQINANSFDGYCKVVISKLVDSIPNQIRDYCHSQISKTILARENGKDKENAFRQKLLDAVKAWERENGIHSIAPRVGSEIDESLEWYLLEAKFGRDFGGRLRDILPEGSEVNSIRALTGGFSGAGIVRIDFTRGESRKRSLIVKISHSEDELNKELSRVRDAQLTSSRFGAVVVSSQGDHVQRIDSQIFCISYPVNEGKTLDEWLLDNLSTREGRPAGEVGVGSKAFDTLMKSVVDVLVRPAEHVLKISEFENYYVLSPSDCARIDVTISTFKRYVTEFTARGLSDDLPFKAASVVVGLERLVAAWKDLPRKLFDKKGLFVCEQHGDLHPRNILVQGDSSIRVIDFARFGPWPVFYDAARLELQIVRRLLDEKSLGDWFPDRFPEWIRFWRSVESDGAKKASNANPIDSFELCRDVLKHLGFARQMISKEANLDAKAAERMYNLCRLFDLLKMISYQDSSLHKRFFFAAMAYEISRKMGIGSEGAAE